MDNQVMTARCQERLDPGFGTVGGESPQGDRKGSAKAAGNNKQTVLDHDDQTSVRRGLRLLSSSMDSSRRMALQFMLLFGANGVALPFAGLWFYSKGLDGATIGILLAAPMLGRLVTGPLIAVWADGFLYRRTALAILALVSALSYALTAMADTFWGWAVFWFVAATASAAMIPLTDAMTVRLAHREGFSFAFPRGCGSAAFVGANVIMGALLTRTSIDAVLIWIVLAAMAMAASAIWILPAEPVTDGAPTRKRDRFKGLGQLARDPMFMAAMVAVGCVQSSHAFYYGFSAIAWKAQGITEAQIGLLWAFSVLVEIAFMWWVEPWRRARGIGPLTLLALGSAAGVMRWVALSLAPPLWMLWPLQALHALTFAATFLAGVQLASQLTHSNSQTAAQTLLSVLSAGVLIGLATLAAGPLYDAVGLGGYLAMAALALLGGFGLLVMKAVRARVGQV